MSLQTRANRKAPPINSWEDELNRVLRNPARSVRFSEESVRRDVRWHPVRADDGLYAKVSLQCPLGNGSRIEIPVRTQNCTHLQCFDLAAYLKAHDRKLLAVQRIVNGLGVDPGSGPRDKKYISWLCPVCKAQAEVRDLHVDGYFDSILQEYKDLQNVQEVKVMFDGSHRPIVKPKVEVFPVSDSPFIRIDEGEAEMHNADEEDVSADAMEITDSCLEEIQRLPETHQLCKAVKRRLLDKFKHAAKMEVIKENPSNAAFATTTHMARELGSSGADDAQLSREGAHDAQLSSGFGSGQAHTVHSEVEKLRSALSDSNHAKVVLHARNEHLQADLLARQARVDWGEHDCKQLRVTNEGLVAENGNLRRRIAELEASTCSSGSGKRQATEECDGVSAKRGKSERGTTSTDIQHQLQSDLSPDRTVRDGFFKNILLSQDLIFKFLVDAPTSETRESFARGLFNFLQEAREDDLSTVDLSSMVNETICRDDRTITDSVLRLITLVPRDHFNDFLRQPQQFLDLVMGWVNESLDNRKRFISVGGLSILLTVIGGDDQRIRSLCHKFPAIFDIVYLLLAACCIAPEQEAPTSAAVTPDARNIFVFEPPAEVHEWITDAQNVQRLIRMLLQYALENSTVCNTISLLCRDNMITTKMVFAHLHSKRLILQLEQRNFLSAFRELMTLKDSYQPQWSSFQELTEVTDTEKDEGVRMDDVADAN